jgi:hypothetical protein
MVASPWMETFEEEFRWLVYEYLLCISSVDSRPSSTKSKHYKALPAR